MSIVIRSTLLFGMAIGLCGCGPTGPYYRTSYDSSPLLPKVFHAPVLDEIEAALKDGKIRSLSVDTGQGLHAIYPPPPGNTLPLLDMLPLPVVVAVDNAYFARARGFEWDQLVPQHDGPPVPVTVIWEVDGSMEVRLGPPLPQEAPPSPTEQEVRQRYRLAALKTERRPWDPAELRVLDLALSRLSPIELHLLEGVSFRRRQRSGHYAGDYFANGELLQIIDLYDSAFKADPYRFIGDVREPLPASIEVVLHEIGHAIAYNARVQLNRLFVARMKDVVTQAGGWADPDSRPGATWTAFVSWVVQARDRTGPAGLLLAQIKDLMARDQQLTALGQRVQAAAKGSLVLREYQRVRGDRKGPTLYGCKDLSESFAEAFALYHADPQALRRVFPEVHAWFEAGGHIAAVQKECGAPCQGLIDQRPIGAERG